MESDGRKHPVHHPIVERFNIPIIVYVTMCTKDRKNILANDSVHQLLRETWQLKTLWLVGKYMVMPDHIHFFCAPGDRAVMALKPWMKDWKSHSARHWPNRQDAPVWQREFWDTQLRRNESYAAKWEYVAENPVRAGLVTKSEDWPYQGELNVLCW